ncbi:glutaredoxin 3 [Saccharobesus litoralis]|uniref:Glutaredoxin n=1 Tax=Saccharobesus litoralis TaxID=2172099 RepID=A0A2S0VQM0_9ALTE|nr:glutaredoxin 3 [Saccharobesus litoralis]AWB66508.1 glutaredoxin 3 [Saccharobesus litoralis]
MASITIYTKPYCPYCTHAKHVLQQKGAKFKEVNIQGDAALRQEMIKRSNGGYTVPQIFIDNKHIGGCDDLVALNARGGLDPLLK